MFGEVQNLKEKIVAESEKFDEKILALKQQNETLIMGKVTDKFRGEFYNSMIEKRENKIAELQKKNLRLPRIRQGLQTMTVDSYKHLNTDRWHTLRGEHIRRDPPNVGECSDRPPEWGQALGCTLRDERRLLQQHHDYTWADVRGNDLRMHTPKQWSPKRFMPANDRGHKLGSEYKTMYTVWYSDLKFLQRPQ